MEAKNTKKETVKGKEVTEPVVEKTTPEKLSYEQLVDVANQLQRQGQLLYQENAQLKNHIGIERVKFLFKILETPELFTSDTVTTAIQEIEATLFPVEAPTEDNTTEAN